MRQTNKPRKQTNKTQLILLFKLNFLKITSCILRGYAVQNCTLKHKIKAPLSKKFKMVKEYFGPLRFKSNNELVPAYPIVWFKEDSIGNNYI